MKLLAAAAFGLMMAAGAENPQLLQIHSVYILPMGNAMDQFLANRLTRFGKMQVVTDAQHADAILTDRLGEPFEKKLDQLYPPPEEKADEKDADDQAGAAASDAGVTLKDAQPNARASFGRGRGTFFLVDRKTRNVLWSTYERPRNSSADELNRTAERVVNNLKRDLKPAQPAQ